MNLRNQLRRDKATFGQLEKDEKLLFIWDYYRVPILFVAVILAVGIILLAGLGRTKTALYVVLVNANSEADTALVPSLFEDSNLDFGGRKIDVETNYTLQYDSFTETDVQTVEVLAVRFGIGDLDVFAANEPVFESYVKKDAFIDLSLFISKEILQKNNNDLYRYKNSDGHEIVGGIWMRQGSQLHQAGLYNEDILIGIASLAENLDNAILFIEQILTEKGA